MDNLYHHINKYMIRIPLSPNSSAELQPDEQEIWLKDLCQNPLFREQICMGKVYQNFKYLSEIKRSMIMRYIS